MEMEAARNAPLTFEQGQRLYCETCGAEIEIHSQGNGDPSGLSLQCCGKEMTPSVGRQVNLGVE